MNCDNFLCVYEKNGKCSCGEISLDIMGACTDCIYITIDPETLDALKKKTLKSLGDDCFLED